MEKLVIKSDDPQGIKVGGALPTNELSVDVIEGNKVRMPCGMELPIEAVIRTAAEKEWSLSYHDAAGRSFAFGDAVSDRAAAMISTGRAADLNAKLHELGACLSLVCMPGSPSPFTSEFGHVRAGAIERLDEISESLATLAMDLRRAELRAAVPEDGIIRRFFGGMSGSKFVNPLADLADFEDDGKGGAA